MPDKTTYDWIRTAGLLSIIPVVIAAGPLAGFFLAEFLVKKFNFPGYTIIVCVILGIVTGIQETIKIIKIALKTKG